MEEEDDKAAEEGRNDNGSGKVIFFRNQGSVYNSLTPSRSFKKRKFFEPLTKKGVEKTPNLNLCKVLMPLRVVRVQWRRNKGRRDGGCDVKKRHKFKDDRTMVQNSEELRGKYWATCLFIRLFPCTANSFASSTLLASLTHFTRSAALIRSLPHSLK